MPNSFNIIFLSFLIFTFSSAYSDDNVPKTMVEPFGGGTGIRFKIKDVSIEGYGNEIHLPQGRKIQISLQLLHDCPECGGALNQVIVGLAGESKAQACIWQGMNYSSGETGSCYTDRGEQYSGCSVNLGPPAVWERKEFSLDIPNKPGIYDIRARYAQAYGCHLGALDWWQVDRSNGPDQNSTIGRVIVEMSK